MFRKLFRSTYRFFPYLCSLKLHIFKLGPKSPNCLKWTSEITLSFTSKTLAKCSVSHKSISSVRTGNYSSAVCACACVCVNVAFFVSIWSIKGKAWPILIWGLTASCYIIFNSLVTDLHIIRLLFISSNWKGLLRTKNKWIKCFNVRILWYVYIHTHACDVYIYKYICARI
jgi:hypothetical protein